MVGASQLLLADLPAQTCQADSPALAWRDCARASFAKLDEMRGLRRHPA
jgi:hypothetical protein